MTHLAKRPVTRWSFSALRDDEKCPLITYYKRIEKVPGPDRPDDHPANVGNQIHAQAEAFIQGEADEVVPALKHVSEKLHELRDKYRDGTVLVEEKWGFTRDWAKTDWSDPDCWAMVRCDVVDLDSDGAGTIEVIDWKTGKRWGNEVAHMQQMQLYTIGGFLWRPEARLVKSTLSYTKENRVVSRTTDRSALPLLLERWESRAHTMTNRMIFTPKPTRRNCRFCDYGTENGNGHCPYAMAFER